MGTVHPSLHRIGVCCPVAAAVLLGKELLLMVAPEVLELVQTDAIGQQPSWFGKACELSSGMQPLCRTS